MKVTMMELRKQPGEYIYHQVYKHGQTVIITHSGKEIAQICPLENTIIDKKGKVHGQTPLTYKKPELLFPNRFG